MYHKLCALGRLRCRGLFFDLAERFLRATDPDEVNRLGDK
jgi:hypothetical protein